MHASGGAGAAASSGSGDIRRAVRAWSRARSAELAAELWDWRARAVDLDREQAAREGRARQRLRVESDAGRGDEQRGEVGAAERQARRPRHRQADRPRAPAVGVVALDPPAVPHGDPQAAVGVGGEAIWLDVVGEARERASRPGGAGGGIDVVRVDHAPARVGEVEAPPVGRERDPVGDGEPGVDAREAAVGVDAEEAAAPGLPGGVERAHPQAAARVALGVVVAMVGVTGLGMAQQRPVAVDGVVAEQPRRDARARTRRGVAAPRRWRAARAARTRRHRRAATPRPTSPPP